ncbi:mRNA-capping enzyme subunit alpha [Lindgomyces ingoldianus]|uniref:mRNA-capping enzyme subunit alpha n=1 Tax=Lindgomyces ingoldianus TaxID=673940 RepID=A0ACB6RE77_9PLEO|nr:mRNA-capping enzyme subunit alpha [Lindgomyces ingoldianus]KAF2477564.1 mRNA-capping enzyme subunit alpha [Lindgomyces ingoldianus]
MHSSVPPQIPGQLVDRHETEELRGVVANLLDRDTLRFPGAQPVSFAREHMAELQRAEYFMCEKTDGIRCLLFLFYRENEQGFTPATFLIDRKNNYYEVFPPLRFPHHQFPLDEDKFLFGTILDGELVHDRVPGQPKPRLIFYVFDCLVIDNQNYTAKPLDRRIGYMKQIVFNPYHAWLQRHPAHVAQDPFRVKEKQVYPPYHVKNMFDHVLPNLPHGNDGLVFTCKSTRYMFGTDKHILKWKPPRENTIDFKLRLGNFPTFDPEDGEDGLIPDYDAMPDRFQLLVQHNQNQYQPFGHDLLVTKEEWEILKGLRQRLDGRIIECYRDDQGRWRYKAEDDGTPRWRDDKKDANHISTVNSVLESIEDPVTEQDLIAVAGRVREAVYRLREAEKQKMHEQIERDPKKRKFSDVNGGA